MNEDFVSYKQAAKLKGLGFDWWVNHYYEDGKLHEGFVDEDEDPELNPNYPTAYGNYNFTKQIFSAPTLSQAQKWLREVKGIDISIDNVYHRLDTCNKVMYGLRIGNQSTFKTKFYMNYDSYEEALSIGIDEAFKILK